jgi:hypothetical protein
MAQANDVSTSSIQTRVRTKGEPAHEGEARVQKPNQSLRGTSISSSNSSLSASDMASQQRFSKWQSSTSTPGRRLPAKQSFSRLLRS